MSNKLVVRL